MSNHFYQSPLVAKYASQEMAELFSEKTKIFTWRKLWIALAEAEYELGLPIQKNQIEELKENIHNRDPKRVKEIEASCHHDVMAEILAWGEVCAHAKPILHLGATSCFVTDNTDLIVMRQGLLLLRSKLQTLLQALKGFAKTYKELPCLSYTHLQAAPLTTMGRRACLWLQDLMIDQEELSVRIHSLKFLGVKGATGTQSALLTLFEGNMEKVEALDRLVSEKMEFSKAFPISSQTYPRKVDVLLLQTLSGFGISLHKMATDIRLLSGFKELEEPFHDGQVGSSAMPHKRNPILSERICALSRFLFSLAENPVYTAATQWLERSLDDSANRRLALAESFLCADALLIIANKVISHLKPNQKVIERRIQEELPFLATETLLMAIVKKGFDRQQMHEKLKILSQKASHLVKEGQENPLFEWIASDETIPLNKGEIKKLLDTKTLIGTSIKQVNHFLEAPL